MSHHRALLAGTAGPAIDRQPDPAGIARLIRQVDPDTGDERTQYLVVEALLALEAVLDSGQVRAC